MKSLTLFCLLLFFTAAVAAQVTTSVRAGASFANVYYKFGNTGEGNQGRLMGYGGVAFNIDLQKQFFLQPEVLYSLRGYRFPATIFSNKGRMTYGYITAPLLVGYKVAKNFSILAGPEIGYMIRARSYFDGTSHDVLSTVGRRFNIDADAGVAWKITSDLSIDARFSFGLTAMYRAMLVDENGNDMGRLNDGYHRVLQVGFNLAL
jgi:hypothetical protein